VHGDDHSARIARSRIAAVQEMASNNYANYPRWCVSRLSLSTSNGLRIAFWLFARSSVADDRCARLPAEAASTLTADVAIPTNSTFSAEHPFS
jgi:hypothetical protein